MDKKIILVIAIVLIALGAGYAVSRQTSDRAAPDNQTSQTTQSGSVETEARASGEVLDLSGQELAELPAWVLERSDITTLNLSNNQLTGLPAGIANLKKLEVLNIENNRFEGSLAEEIGQLKNLREIRANNNRMTGIPASIGNLANLEIADFSNNRLTNLPLELGNLTQLKLLDLSGYDASADDIRQIKAKLTGTEVKT